MRLCKYCKLFTKTDSSKIEGYCEAWHEIVLANGYCYKHAPVRTKADCIRDMNDNELANFLQGMCPPEFHPCPFEDGSTRNCFICWLDYLGTSE